MEENEIFVIFTKTVFIFFFNYFKEVNYLLPCSYGRYMYVFIPSNVEILP